MKKSLNSQIHSFPKLESMMIQKENLAQLAKDKYPVSVSYKGRLSEEELTVLEMTCDIHCLSLHMDGSAVYSIIYKKNDSYML